ncbi:MAG: UMP kinase [Hydrogenovibrio crunogenus]|uniref:Uridylate kinase n=1 Tax=Hydrogenovibrio crunogenus (strain DSM 25203 / XCL-2) TaxID=317025 RepID=PYRH_HYDCU|nr:RecName: Full=Uridylate kinase; Short=UK; AltName: Full=Uridine monophosphate kinase; Short=UMP kinase; Short=UMPK [Hydrogenovibrio crunogenus XCL-2]MBD3611886.1 UMP kinase [Hydrogenovibrio crunogenus]
MSLKYARVLLKFSGEALMGQGQFGLDSNTLRQVVLEVKALRDLGVEVGLVVGGGNIFRGAQIEGAGIQRTTGDHMGMMATVINALALRDVIEDMGMSSVVYSAMAIEGVSHGFNANHVKKGMAEGQVAIFAAGTGSPFFTTDTAAALRGIEIDADIVLKATKVDGIYTADPAKDSSAQRLAELTYDDVIQKNLQVMDMTAFVLCRDHKMPIRVFDMFKKDAVIRIVKGEDEGTLVH